MGHYYKLNRSSFAGALICVFVSDLLAVILQFFKGDVLDSAVAGDTRRAIGYASLLAAFILLEVGFFYCYSRLCARFSSGCARALKADVWESILRRSYTDCKSRPKGEYIAKYTSEADAIRDRRFAMLPMLWEIIFKIVFVSSALFVLDWRIAAVALLLLTTPLYIPKLIEKRLQKAQSEYLEAVEANLSAISDWLSGFEIIKNFSIERQVLRRFAAGNDRQYEKQLADARLGALAQLITTLISYLSYFIILVCSTWLVLAGDFSAGDFFVAIGMVDQLSYPLIALSGIIRQLVAIRPVCAGLEKFIGYRPTADELPAKTTLQRGISYIDVDFDYGGGPLLHGFSLDIARGERCLLRGPSGCGKTTAVNLLLKYHKPSGGRIEIDGEPIEQLGDTYGIFTVVRQDAVLFRDTLRSNLAMYRDIDDAVLTGMLHKVGLEKFADAKALDEMITEGGANLSGGEKMRICLARALLRDTDVLILDEPLANLDPSSAALIEELLLSVSDRTLLVVSHQFSSEKLNRFDKIYDFTAI